MSDAPDPTTPKTLGRYELLLPVARGGMGQVWAGRLRGARGFNKLVAVKTLLAPPGAEGRMENMLLEEARIAALIHHPNVVQTQELGEHEGSLYLVMEWVDGEPLSFILNRATERNGLPLPLAVNLAAQTLLGLHAAHELTDETGKLLGVVHRDVSPHNVLVTYSGVAKLVDFGIAKATNQDSSVTEAGEVKGKYSYMAPEQIRCEAVDRRADLFALGILLFTLTTGRHPFRSEHPAGVLHKISGDKPSPRPSQFVPDYSPALEAVLMKSLEKAPESRFRTAEEMFVALQQAVPEAFTAGIETLLRDYLTTLLGDRATARREALRRAQVAADLRTGSGSHLAINPSSSQSASSLQALSIDAPSAEAEARAPRPSSPPTLPAPALKRSKRGLVLGAALVAALAVIGGVVRGVSPGGFASSAAAPPAAMVELPATARNQTPSNNPSAEPTAPAATPTANSNGASPEPLRAPSAGGASPAPAPVTETPGSGSAGHAPRNPTTKSRPRPRSRDLIAPDYAR
ncbi:MAG TPA: serine/threonine-protein kinase [Polyangiaceae bacterium]|nr:serine/threonine-protein kinase [Polyangiaceae bacterium]